MTTPDFSDTWTAPAPGPSRGARVLVVDDVEANVLVLSKMIRVLGHATSSAPDGEEAIRKAKAERPDLVLMDVMMPGIDGIEATRRLKADPDTRLIPIVVVTALSDNVSKKRAIDAGADDFLGKPVDAMELQLRVKSLLSVKRTYDALDAERRKAADADRLKTQFLTSVSHELRTPLTAIASAAKILVKHRTRADALERFPPMILEQSERLARLLDDVLDMAKLESGGVTFREETFLAAEIVTSVGKMFQPIAEEKGLKLDLLVRPADPGRGAVRGDRDRLTQVLVNLMSNAVKFTSAGGAVRIAMARVGPDEAPRWGVSPPAGCGAVLVAVEDTGVGIAPENQQVVFEKFRQVEEPGRGRPQGTGLGLAICREIVERHRGRIGLRSEPGQGSRFTVVLPEVVPAPVSAARAAGAVAGGARA